MNFKIRRFLVAVNAPEFHWSKAYTKSVTKAQPRITTKKLWQQCYCAGAALFTRATGNFVKPSFPAKRKIKYKSTQDRKNIKSKVITAKSNLRCKFVQNPSSI